jgi:hypothetical protein
MAIGAGAAQASTWMVGGVNLAANAESAAVEGSLENNDGALLTTISSLAIKILCTSGTFENVKLKGTDTTSNGKVLFEGCEVYKDSNGEALHCGVHTSGSAAGIIKTTEGHGLVELHNNATNAPDELATLVIPNNAESRFATLLTSGCTLPEVVPVFGSLALRDCEGKGEVEQATHLVVELPALSHVFVISDTAEHAAKLVGSANVSLNGGAAFRALKE